MVTNISDRQFESLALSLVFTQRPGGLKTSEDGWERIRSTARLPSFPSHGNTGMEPQQSVPYDQLNSATAEF